MEKPLPSLLQSLIPLAILMGLIGLNMVVAFDNTVSGANQLALLLASAIAAGIALYNGTKWDYILEKVVQTISSAVQPIIILFIIGMLSGTWMLSGIVPTMIYYGLEILHPSFFLPATLIMTAIISVVTGSSWSTIATIGVALVGIGTALGFNSGIVAGAIISGAYFGDKISPLSDTTILAATVAETPLFTHIKYMLQTTVPSFLISLGIFIVISLLYKPGTVETSPSYIQDSIGGYYNISPFLLLVPLVTVWMIYKRYSTIIVLLAGALLGGVVAIIAQPEVIASIAGDSEMTVRGAYTVVTKAMYATTTVNTGSIEVDNLLSTGGMAGMLNTVWLIITAMTFGGVLEAGQFLETITTKISSKVKTASGAVTVTSSMTLLFNVTSGDQYTAIVIPGKMFAKLFTKLKLRPELLSRTLEDSGTVTSVLIPWNTCGATQASILGVATLTYAPYAFFCLISPIMTLIFAWFNIKIKKLDDKKDESLQGKEHLNKT